MAVKHQSAHRWPRAIKCNPHHLVLWPFLGLSQLVYVRDDMSKGLKIMSLGMIIMKSETPEKFEKLLPNDYWLLVPWRFYAWHPHHTSRDWSRFLRMILFINNTKNAFYETKVLKTKHVSFLKYIYNALLISYRTFGPVSLRNLPVQHEIYWSLSVGPVPISTAVLKTHIWHWFVMTL